MDLIASGLRQLNDDHGGRYRSRIADAVGVDKESVRRWLGKEVLIQFENCEKLASTFPYTLTGKSSNHSMREIQTA